MRVATLAAGYADGVPWALTNRGSVLVRGKRRSIVGRVSMDLITIAVDDDAVAPGDEAVLFGAQDGARLSVEEVAAAAGTVSYEILTRVAARVPRVVVRGA